MAKKRLSDQQVQTILRSMNRVLNNRNVKQSVEIKFAAAGSPCWKRVCQSTPGGGVRCKWVQC